MTMKKNILFWFLSMNLFTSCGDRMSTSVLADKPANDPAIAQFKQIFSSAKSIPNTPESLASLKLDRIRSCLLMEAVLGSLSTSLVTQKLTRFAGLLKSDMTFEETFQVQTIMKFGDKDLFTQVASAVSRPLMQPANVYVRRTEDGRLAEEWAIQGEELLKVTSARRGTMMARANNLLDASVAEPSRYALFYVLCE